MVLQPTVEDPPRPSLRERNKARTREELVDVARRLFAERGFAEVTIDEVADEAGVSRRTFFRYFDSKEDVLLADNAVLLDRLVSGLAARPPSEPVLTSVRTALLGLSEDYEADRERMLVGARIMADAPSVTARALELQVEWEAAIARHVAGRLHADMGELVPRVVAASAIAATRAALATWLASGGEGHLIELTGRALELLGDGLDRISPARSHGGQGRAPRA